MKYRNILLIDDDEEDQEIFSDALRKVSCASEFLPLSNARIALDKLIKYELTPDVIFLDLNMPVMNGQEFLSSVKKIGHLRNIPVIIFSTSSNPSTIAATRDLGAIDFITKPSRFDELIDILRPIVTS
jgi:CheY-like chemotaxis protein